MLIQFKKFLLVIAIVFANLINPVYAGDKDPLFINLSSSEAHRSKMAIGLGKNNMERGHPLTIFINDQAVLIASKSTIGIPEPRFIISKSSRFKDATVPLAISSTYVKSLDCVPSP